MELSSPQRQQPLSAQVAAQVRAMIVDGAWPVGAKIPAESELTRTLGISRNSLREALRALVHTGLLEARIGDGTYVRADSELQVALRRRVGSARADDVFEVRALLEQRCALLAARTASPEDIATIRAALERRNSAHDVREYLENDLEFHQAIANASGNLLLAELYRDIDDITKHFAEIIRDNDDFDLFKANERRLTSKHFELLAAITKHNPETAERIAGDIVEEVRMMYPRTEHEETSW